MAEHNPLDVEPMPPKTLEALFGSIAKWETIVAGTGEDQGYLNCPLCKLFNTPYRCTGCPVMEATGQNHCDGTPYDAWLRAIRKKAGNNPDSKWIASDDQLRTLAQAELDFLKSLIPAEAT